LEFKISQFGRYNMQCIKPEDECVESKHVIQWINLMFVSNVTVKHHLNSFLYVSFIFDLFHLPLFIFLPSFTLIPSFFLSLSHLVIVLSILTCLLFLYLACLSSYLILYFFQHIFLSFLLLLSFVSSLFSVFIVFFFVCNKSLPLYCQVSFRYVCPK
jgi:hypothetical protein